MATPKTGRPRGRPPGAKNIVRTPEGLVAALSSPVSIPPVVKRPKDPKARGRMSSMTPEERSAEARRLQAARTPEGRARAGRKKGVPGAYTAAQYEQLRAQERPRIDRIIKIMADEGVLPDDLAAVAAMKETLLILRTAETIKDKLAAAALVLNYTKAKPTVRVEQTIKTAEQLLDEMADD